MSFVHHPVCFRSGFSLLEMLFVIAIVAVISGLAIPAISSMTQARGVGEAGYLVAAAIENARAEALARNTYVLLGIEETVTAGTKSVTVGSVFLKDGDLQNLNSTNLQPLGRPSTVQRVGLASTFTNLGNGTQLNSHSGGPGFSIGQTQFSSNRTLIFAPSGEVASAAPAPGQEFRFTPRLGLGMQAARGANFLDPNQAVDVLIDGGTGIPQVRRFGQSSTP